MKRQHRQHAALEPWRDHYPFSSHFLEVEGVRLHFLDECTGMPGSEAPTLLFVHGNPTWSFHWRRLIAAWRHRARCVAVDHLGCGLSDLSPRPLRLVDRIKHLLQFIDALELRQITLIAQDWGGAIGLGAAIERPERFSRFVLLNTGAFPPPYIPWRIRFCRIPLAGRLAVQGANLFSRAALRMAVAGQEALESNVAAGYLAPYHSWRRRRAVQDFVDDIPARTTHPTWSALARIESHLPSLASRPALLVWGMRDWCFRPECLARFAAAWPHAQIERLPDAGHWVLEDAPDHVRHAVETFLQGRDSSDDIARAQALAAKARAD